MLHGGVVGDLSLEGGICAPYRFQAGSLSHVAGSTRGALVIVGGAQQLVSLELVTSSSFGGGGAGSGVGIGVGNEARNVDAASASDHLLAGSGPAFSFERRRALAPFHCLGRARASRCTGVAFLPDSDSVAVSCTNNGYVCLWDMAVSHPEPLLAQWPAHKGNINSLTFLPLGGEARLVTAGIGGSLDLWKLDGLLERVGQTQEQQHSGLRPGVPSAGDVVEEGLPWANSSQLGDAVVERRVDLRAQRHNRTPVLDLHAQPWGEGGARLLVVQEDGMAGVHQLHDGMSAAASSSVFYTVSHKPLLSGRFSPQMPTIFATASQDQVLRVMDTRSNPRDGCLTKLRPNTSIGCVRWRPERPDQIATTGSAAADCVAGSGHMSAGILVWDLRRPHVPLHQFGGQGDLQTDFFWADSNHIVSCSRDSSLYLHAVSASHQPWRLLCCSAASWKLNSSGVEGVAVVAEDVDRDVEPGVDALGAICELKEAVCHRGFEPDIGQEINSEAFEQDLSEETVYARYCHVLSLAGPHRQKPVSGKPSENERGFLELSRVDSDLGLLPCHDVRQGSPKGERSASQVCAAEADRCSSMGLPMRSQTWRLLSEVVGDIDPSQALVEAILAEDSTVADSTPCHRRQPGNAASPLSRGAGAQLTTESLRYWGFNCFDRSPVVHSRSSDSTWNSTMMERESSGKIVQVSLDRWRMSWRRDMLASVISVHEERNDVGMLLALVGALGVRDQGMTSEEARLVRERVLRWAQGAADVLGRMRAFVARTALLRSLPFPEVHALAQKNTQLYVRCAHCRQMAEPSQGSAVPRKTVRNPGSRTSQAGGGNATIPSGTSIGASASVGVTGPRSMADPSGEKVSAAAAFCSGCQRPQVPVCSVCGDAVHGLWVGCQVCGHGGHPRHIREWFASGATGCPAGCPHQCVACYLPLSRSMSQHASPGSIKSPSYVSAEGAMMHSRRLSGAQWPPRRLSHIQSLWP